MKIRPWFSLFFGNSVELAPVRDVPSQLSGEGDHPVGLDVVEFVMECEEHFGVVITDDQAWRMRTVGDLYAYLLAQDCRKASLPCPTSQAFYRLRRSLTGNLGIERSRVRPSTRLRDLVPGEDGLGIWHRLSDELSPLDVPDPNPPPRGPTARALGIGLIAAAVGASLVFLLLVFGERLQIALMVALFFWLGASLIVLMIWAAAWFSGRYEMPVPIPRVRDLVFQMAAQKTEPDPYRSPIGRTPETVWSDMTAIISRATGTPAHEIRPEYRFWSDLGA